MIYHFGKDVKRGFRNREISHPTGGHPLGENREIKGRGFC